MKFYHIILSIDNSSFYSLMTEKSILKLNFSMSIPELYIELTLS